MKANGFPARGRSEAGLAAAWGGARSANLNMTEEGACPNATRI